jgi:hypothetical protein
MYKRGDYIEILPEFQDDGDDSYRWVCITDEEKGMVDVSPEGTGLRIPPIYAVRVEWIVPDRSRTI